MTAETALPPVLVLLLGSVFGLFHAWVRLIHLRAEARVLRRARDVAEEALRAKAAFVSTVSHEVRTPLNAVVGFAELLATTPLDREQAEYAQGIRDGSAHLLSVIGDVLDYGRIEAGRLTLEERAFEVGPLVAGCVKAVSVAATGKGLVLWSRCEPDMEPWLQGDATRVRQVLLNLLSNAVKFTPAGSVALAVSTHSEEGGRVRLEFEVSDTGIGIPDDQVPRLFRPFSQLGATAQGGTGLGLAISRHLCERMGGAILVRSQPGSGSTFTAVLRLPRAQPAVEPAAAPVPRLAPMRVLLVEDNAMNLRLSRRILERQGHHVEVATDGAQAVAMVRKRAYGAVLLDAHMPVMDGLEAARQICRGMGKVRPLLIGLTASTEDRAACLRAGMDGHLLKPLDTAQLARVLVAAEATRAPKRDRRRAPAVAAAG